MRRQYDATAQRSTNVARMHSHLTLDLRVRVGVVGVWRRCVAPMTLRAVRARSSGYGCACNYGHDATMQLHRLQSFPPIPRCGAVAWLGVAVEVAVHAPLPASRRAAAEVRARAQTRGGWNP